jgi:hypothetical protein
MAFIQKLESIDQMVDRAHEMNKAEMVEVYHSNGDASRFHVIKNTSTTEEVCTVTDRYSILQHSDALNLILTGIQSSGITGAGTVRNYGNNVVVETYFDNLTVRDHSQDGHIQLGMRFTNSFDKSIGFNGTSFGWRQSCSNGLLTDRMLPNAPHISFKHMGNVIERITASIKTFVEDMVKMEGSLLTIMNEAQNEIITFSSMDQLITFTSQYTGSERRAKLVFDLEPIELETTKWALYNSLTAYATHNEALSYNQYNTIHEGAQKLILSHLPPTPIPLTI